MSLTLLIYIDEYNAIILNANLLLDTKLLDAHTNSNSTCLLKYSGPLLRIRRGTEEQKGVVGPAALLSGRAGASVSVGMATRRLGWPAVVAAGVGGLTEGGGSRGPPKHEDTR